MEQMERRLAAIEASQAEHGAALRGIGERLDRILEILTPPDSAGPTLDEILAQLVTVISDQTFILRRLDGRTAAMAVEMGLEEVELPAPSSASGRRSGKADKLNGHAEGHEGDEEPPAT